MLDSPADLPSPALVDADLRSRLSREAIIPLMSLALINRHDKLLSMHRLTQSAFLTRSDDRTAQQWFDNVTSLLYHAFPHSSNGLAPDGDWTACTPLISHVDHLLTCWDHLRTRGRQLRGNDHLSLLLQAATW